jgi:hypothetical protein
MSTISTLDPKSKTVLTISPPCPICPTCGKEMRLTGATPTSGSTIYEYLCSNDGDRLSWRPDDRAKARRLAQGSTPRSG